MSNIITNPFPHAPKFLLRGIDISKRHHNLPHWEQGETCIFVTFRLADSVPATTQERMQEERDIFLAANPRPWNESQEKEYRERFGRRFQKLLDAGHGSCILGDEKVREIVAESIMRHDGEDCEIYAFVVMPNHVHVLFALAGSLSLSQIMKRWKGSSAHAINAVCGECGTLWMSEYWDTLIRSQKHFDYVVKYIRDNPKGRPIPVYVSDLLCVSDPLSVSDPLHV